MANRTRNRGPLSAVRRVDIRQLRRLGFLREGSIIEGTLRWTGAQPLAPVSVTVDFRDPCARTIRLETQPGRPPWRISVEALPMRFGGLRYYLTCPWTGARCEVLCVLNGTPGSRRHHRLTYPSQSEDKVDRCHRALRRIESALPRSRGDNRVRLLAEKDARWAAIVAAFSSRVAARYGIAL